MLIAFVFHLSVPFVKETDGTDWSDAYEHHHRRRWITRLIVNFKCIIAEVMDTYTSKR